MVQRFSNWFFNSKITFEEIEKKISDNQKKLSDYEQGRSFETVKKGKATIDGLEVEYISGAARYQWIKRGYENKPKNEQMGMSCEPFIIYKDEDSIKLVILGSKSSSEKIIPKLFTKATFGQISEQNDVKKDLLYWIFYRLREFPDDGALPGTRSELYLRGLEGYMGTSKDKVNLVRGHGNRVMALMGTLSFIFYDENLKALRPKIQYRDIVISIEFHSNNSNKIIMRDAVEINNLNGPSTRQIENSLLVCKVILPKLLSAYNFARDNNTWSDQIKLAFLRNIGNDINDKVQYELSQIEKKIKNIADEDELNDIDHDDILCYRDEIDEFEFLEDDGN